MELHIAVRGGLIPATILGLVLLLAALLTRRPRTGPTGPPVAEPPPGDHSAAPNRRWRLAAAAWPMGFALALPWIHFASWSWPRWWPVDATARLLHSGGVLAAWAVVEALLLPALPEWAGARSGRRLAITAARWLGRGASVGTILAVLLHPYLGVLGWPGVLGGVLGGTALALVGTATSAAAHRAGHPVSVWSAHFLAALGATGVLLLGRTATAAQAAAGLAALAAATLAVVAINRRNSPGPVAGFLLSGTLVWLLAVGCFASGETNLASAALVLLAPASWALPRRLVDLDLFWTRVPVTTALAAAWTIGCIAAAVGIAAATQSAAPEPYAF